MLRLLIGMMVTVTVARWMYSEVRLIAPSAIPTIDYVLEKVQIPTHDKWPEGRLYKMIAKRAAQR
ncbi:MAG: hypothetical protein D6808_03960 [Candidatus Dadabacteria bacterium]|nr:MAG: hypothetical protein D6808_03960 [Candidatus Dadabacteria bacterium]